MYDFSKFMSAFLSSAVRLGGNKDSIEAIINQFKQGKSDDEKITLSHTIDINDMVLTDFTFLNEKKYAPLFDEINKLLQRSGTHELQALKDSITALKGINAFNLQQKDIGEFKLVLNNLETLLSSIFPNLTTEETANITQEYTQTVEREYRAKLKPIYKKLTGNDMDSNQQLKSVINGINLKYHPDKIQAALTEDQEDAYKAWTGVSQQYGKAISDIDQATHANYLVLKKFKEENSSKLFWWRFHSIALFTLNVSITMLSATALHNNAENFHSSLYYPVALYENCAFGITAGSLLYLLYAQHTALKENADYMKNKTNLDCYIDTASMVTSRWVKTAEFHSIAILGLLYAINGASGVTEELPMQLLAMTVLSIPSLVCISTSLVESKASLPKFLHGAYDLYHYGVLGTNYISIDTSLNQHYI